MMSVAGLAIGQDSIYLTFANRIQPKNWGHSRAQCQARHSIPRTLSFRTGSFKVPQGRAAYARGRTNLLSIEPRMLSAISPPIGPMSKQAPPCQVCGGPSEWLDALDFNKSCDEAQGRFLPRSGVLVAYALCSNCGFCFAPQIYPWSPETFERWIYNDAYVEVDPDYLGARPRNSADTLGKLFPQVPPARHLDYGGGNGMLANIPRERGWDSSSYDPFLERDRSREWLGQFDLITAFEVFEHVPDISALMGDLRQLRATNGIVLFSTLVSDEDVQPNKSLSWWYAAPRNGHISLFSQKSLGVIASRLSLNFASLSSGFHALFGTIPTWASHLIRAG
jgi:SAM-dependent methyltransferase